MNQRVPLISGSSGVAKTKKLATPAGKTDVSPTEVDPKDGYSAGAGTLPSQETVERAESSTAKPAAKEAVSPPQEQPRVEAAPTTLSMEQTPQAEPAEEGMTLADIAKSATAAVGRTFRKLILGDPLADFQKDLSEINKLEDSARELKTPAQFAAKTQEFKDRLSEGETLDDIRNEAYAVAREAARQTTKMRAYDCQILGGLAMNHGQIAEMRTGEGKTLTAVMPLYLNALAGKGAHLITVNETLAKRDSEWMGPIFKKLGMTVGCVLEDQNADKKREGYNCDVTYLTDRTLGFDFLRDRTARDPEARVQRGHFFGLVDEVDEVMIDEARTPMILSVKGGEPSKDYELFAGIMKGLKPGQDFQVDEQQTSVWLTEGGLRFVENETVLKAAQTELEGPPAGSSRERELKETIEQAKERQKLLVSEEHSGSSFIENESVLRNALSELNGVPAGSLRAKELRDTINQAKVLRHAIRNENAAQKAFDDEDDKKPNIFSRMVGIDGEYDSDKADKLETSLKAATKLREQLSKGTPQLDLYAPENFERVHCLDACLKAHVLQVKGKHYSVEGGEVKIIDQNKGRVSQGKRFSNGLHQGIEAKEGVPVRKESRTAASITLPELFNTYERKSGMTGTGKSSEAEFHHFYGLPVVEIPTNKPVIREDHKDVLFGSLDEKFNAVVDEAVQAAKDGRPILIGTLSVNANKAVAARLLKAGWPADRLQVLNADTVRGSEDVHEENAGRSGTITLVTGDRADKVMADPVNYKKMAVLAEGALSKGQGVVMDADNPEDAQQLQAWLGGMGSVKLVDKPEAAAAAGEVVIRVGARGKVAEGSTHIDAKDHAVEKPLVLDVDPNNMDPVVDSALEAYFEGQPVVLRAKSGHGLGASAERLLDAGLGLESLPMVCEGKEKENLLIEMAGRSGFITVATNMAGRGANIKPDLVKIDEIAENAYQGASENGSVVVDLDKDSQAVKILRRLEAHCPVAIAEKPDQKPLPGQVLIRSKQGLKDGESLPPVDSSATQLKGSDYQTGGLYVIGTERSNSRRIDDQLIGRAGRQGAEGDSRFFLSTQDDMFRLAQEHRREELFEAMEEGPDTKLWGGPSGVSNGSVSKAIEELQTKLEVDRVDSRQNADKFDETMKLQRKTFFKFREKFVSGGEIDGEKVDPKEFMADFAATGLADELNEALGDKRKYSPEELKTAAAQLGKRIGMPLNIDAKKPVKRRDLVEALYPSVADHIENSPLADSEWKSYFLYAADEGWKEQLEDMAALRDGVQLEAIAGKKPEEVYIHRGFEVFEGMVGRLKRRLGTLVVPHLVRRGNETNSPA